MFSIPIAHAATVALLDPKGPIASQERGLIGIAVLFMLVLVLPLIILIFTVAWRYRARSGDATRYKPDDHRAPWTEFIWWVLPCIIVAILATITWKATHALDPREPLSAEANVKPLVVDVVALQWKWLFIYPEQNVATVNFLQFPAGVPINFELTAGETAMNSLWIPQLGSQMYAMPGMTTELHLIANAPGEFSGLDTELNGRGFAGMKFVAKATSEDDFDAWVASVKQTAPALTQDGYAALAVPSENVLPSSYSAVPKGLYNKIVTQFMAPGEATSGVMMNEPSAQDMSGMKM